MFLCSTWGGHLNGGQNMICECKKSRLLWRIAFCGYANCTCNEQGYVTCFSWTRKWFSLGSGLPTLISKLTGSQWQASLDVQTTHQLCCSLMEMSRFCSYSLSRLTAIPLLYICGDWHALICQALIQKEGLPFHSERAHTAGKLLEGAFHVAFADPTPATRLHKPKFCITYRKSEREGGRRQNLLHMIFLQIPCKSSSLSAWHVACIAFSTLFATSWQASRSVFCPDCLLIGKTTPWGLMLASRCETALLVAILWRELIFKARFGTPNIAVRTQIIPLWIDTCMFTSFQRLESFLSQMLFCQSATSVNLLGGSKLLFQLGLSFGRQYNIMEQNQWQQKRRR